MRARSTYFYGCALDLSVDNQGNWLTHLQEMPNISAFGDKDYQQKQREIPVASRRQKILVENR